ncbi:autotransporter secretion outer membrane protein TamA [Modicisalibacter xianhensis]|uniref:Translocation and assembly module subunit TamA n=2 Tax=Modicisalibacter xianhensis TaxID=442341 RepID=A0A1I3CFI5_9GAMM|nr:autotransporter assembly complex family protein [Halomonas xianhensis]SFH73153.1 autotransporter secretion outer membrane protein TamA [Halomonas xianhensis]
MPMSRQVLLIVSLSAGVSVSPALALQADIQGIEGEAAENVANYLAAFDATEYGKGRVRSEVARRTRDALKAYGYYEPELDITLVGDNPVERARLQIQLGPRVTITELDVSVEGDASDDEAFRQVLDDLPLEEGEPLRHEPYESLRGRFSTLAVERGYFDANFTDRRIEVRPWEESARIYLTLDSGERYVFGNVRFDGSQIEESRLRNMMPFDSGDPYLAGSLAVYSQRLGETGWFRSVSVRPRLQGPADALIQAHRGWWEAVDTGTASGGGVLDDSPLLSASAVNAANRLGRERPPRVPVDVNLIPADRHQFEVGIGYATDVGPRTQFSWEQPWLNEDGDSLSHELYLSAPEQYFSGTYTIPLANPLTDSYELTYGLKNEDNEDTQSLEASVEVARRWLFENGWTQRLYFRTTYEDFTQADQEDQVLLMYPGISWARVRTRNPRFPSWGDRQRLSLAASSDIWGSDASFLRATLDSQWIRMLGEDTRFVGRTSIGAMHTDDFDKIPPSLRFFAGGDQSVRGYSYESLAPENEDGELLGGQHLLTASLEAQRRITGDWWGAAFVDTGNAFNSWWPDELATGAGLGVRWVSPVGPVRFDIAHPFDNEEDSWRLHFAIGPEF